jgi:hypothetical protein
VTPRTVDLLNIGLMFASLAAAFALPFELFLFSYAVLGPLHYLTEISWLGERNFFTRGKRDWIPLAALTVLVLFSNSYIVGRWHIVALAPYWPQLTFAAFALAFVFAIVPGRAERIVGAIAVLVVVTAFAGVGARSWLLFGIFVTTILHVCVFTGAFMLFGALKSRSTTGYVATALLVVCSLIALFAPAQASTAVSSYVSSSYASFHVMNTELARVLGFGTTPPGSSAPFANYRDLLTSGPGIALQRFIAFAYTYHYLNWFSKTSIIRWHKVDRRKLAFASAVWIASLALYASSYELGAKWLFLLSFAHVLLEFPLNHLSFVGIGNELSARVRGGRSGVASSRVAR